METEAEIKASIKTTKLSMDKLFDKAKSQLDREDFDMCLDTLFTLTVNIAALESAVRVIED